MGGSTVNRQELFNVVSILERLDSVLRRDLPGTSGDPVWSMIVFLMKAHLEDRVVTVTTLADASGAPRASARRRIEEMARDGLIEFQPSSRTGRRHAIAPSRELFARVTTAASRALDTIVELAGPDGAKIGDRPRASGISYPHAAPEGFDPSVELSILAYEDPVFRALRKTRWEIESFLGVRVKLTVLPHTDLRKHLITVGSPPGTDLVSVDFPWLGEFVERGLLRPISDLVSGSGIDRADFYGMAWNAGFYEGRQYAIPIQPTVELLWYRADILERMNITPPRTLDEVLDTARRVHQPNRNLHGIVWPGARGDQLAQCFLQIMGAVGRPLISASGADEWYDSARTGDALARVDCPEGREAARYMRALLPFSPPDILSLSWDDVATRFGFGQAALCYTWSNRASMMDGDDIRRLGARVGFAPHPGLKPGKGWSPMGGVVLGIPTTVPEERLPLVWKALERLVSPEIMKFLAVHGSGAGARFRVAADRYVAQRGPIIPYVDEMVKNDQIQTWQRPPIPKFERLCEMLGDELHIMLSGHGSVERSLAEAQRRIDLLLDQRDPFDEANWIPF